MLHENGYGCASCELCGIVRGPNDAKRACRDAHQYGMRQAERFGGKYIYFCPMGLTCFVSPIMGESVGLAKVTVGPFLMVERDDYVNIDLKENARLDGDALARASAVLERLPSLSPERVNPLSSLLFMAVGFLNNVAVGNKMLETQGSDAIQGQISDYIAQLKLENPRLLPAIRWKRSTPCCKASPTRTKAEARVCLTSCSATSFSPQAGNFKRSNPGCTNCWC